MSSTTEGLQPQRQLDNRQQTRWCRRDARSEASSDETTEPTDAATVRALACRVAGLLVFSGHASRAIQRSA